MTRKLGTYISHYDSFDKPADIDSLEVQKRLAKSHGEDNILLHISDDDAMLLTYFHGRDDDTPAFASGREDDDSEFYEAMVAEMSEDPTIVTMKDMEKLIIDAGFKNHKNYRKNLLYRDDE